MRADLAAFFLEFIDLFLPSVAAAPSTYQVNFPHTTVLDFHYHVIQWIEKGPRASPGPIASKLDG